MKTEYIVEGLQNGVWVILKEYDDPVQLGLAMWELGRSKTGWKDIRITECVDEVPAAWVEYLVKHHNCSKELAVAALKENGVSVIHAGYMLADSKRRAWLESRLGGD